VATVDLETEDEIVGLSVCGILSLVVGRSLAGHVSDSETFTAGEIHLELGQPLAVVTCCSPFNNAVLFMTAVSSNTSELWLPEIPVLEQTDTLRPSSSAISTSSRSPVYGLII